MSKGIYLYVYFLTKSRERTFFPIGSPRSLNQVGYGCDPVPYHSSLLKDFDLQTEI
uniref:Uncharacterized protein n=1 Tax=Arion vulgaris TaxID=1028688 RepID=A0A0B7BTT7_9EUPU